MTPGNGLKNRDSPLFWFRKPQVGGSISSAGPILSLVISDGQAESHFHLEGHENADCSEIAVERRIPLIGDTQGLRYPLKPCLEEA